MKVVLNCDPETGMTIAVGIPAKMITAYPFLYRRVEITPELKKRYVEVMRQYADMQFELARIFDKAASGESDGTTK